MSSTINRNECPNELLLSTREIDLSILKPKVVKLANGVEIAYFQNADTELVKIDVLFEAGSRYQSYPLVAAATNNLLTEGTKTKTASEIADFLDFRGSYIEKSTEKDDASISIYLVKKYIQDIIPIFHEIIFEPVFPQQELDLYLRRKKQQFLVDSQKVSYLARVNFAEMIFGKENPYGKTARLIDFENVKREHIVAFHQQRYLQTPFQVIVSGNVEDDLLSLLSQYFGNLTFSKSPQILSFPAFVQDEKQKFVEVPDAVQSALRIGSLAIPSFHKDFHELSIVNTLLGGYFGSRLMKNIREEKGYTYGIYSGLQTLQKTSAFFVTAEVGIEYSQLAIDEIYIEIQKLIQAPVEQEELDLVRNFLIGNFLRSLDGIFEISERYKGLLQMKSTPEYFVQYLQTLETSTPEKLQQIAKQYLQPENMVQVCVGKL